VFIGFARHDVLKLEYSPLVVDALMTAFPRYTSEKANAKIGKYVKTLERLMRRAKLNKPSKRSNKKKTYKLEATVLWDKTGQLGSNKIRIHQWLKENKVPLVINTNPNYKPTKELAVFKTTKYLTIKDESLLNKLRKMTVEERHVYLDTPSKDDVDEINDYLKDYRALSIQEQSNRYDLAEIDIESLKNYILKLARGDVFIEHEKQESDADNSEYILRIAQLNNRQLPQLKDKSDFGRTYYKMRSVQNVSKRVREALLGDCWEYDSKSCAASWKMAFAQEFYNSKKRHDNSFEDSFSAMTLFLEYKSDFYNEVIDKTFLAEYPYSNEYKTKFIKSAMTAVGFGAKLTMGSWTDKDGDIKSSSLLEVFDDDKTLLRRFVDCTIVREYNHELSTLNKYILNKFSCDMTWLADLEASRIKKNRKPYSKSQRASWLFQHAETLMMNIVRKKLQKLGKTVLANVHDAIVVGERLTASELLAIEKLVRRITKVQYFALGETPYVRCL
jgi:hypothetical protein